MKNSIEVPASTFGAPTYTRDGANKVRPEHRKVGKHVMSVQRKRWLAAGKNKANLTAVEEMTSGSASLARHVKVDRTGGLRSSSRRKFPVTVTMASK